MSDLIRPPLDRPEVDPKKLAQLRQMVGEARIGKLLAAFRAEVAAGIASIRRDEAAGNREAVATIAHSLKGAAANLGATRLSEAGRALQDGARGDAALAPLVAELEAAAQIVIGPDASFGT